ncbi:hypothetical protein [Puerhibacterium puerhi]|uniref:hypothetical protein n=1 Tax=Puerhibacterium puerhi TaxID=2692623 RepID=UPI0013588A6A|nr:hypothetical protein [Puerhibacterium puerhi]
MTALEKLADLAAAVATAERDAQTARDERDAAIREALAAGVSVADIVAATGLHRQRVYQIRDSG